ncbi:MAG: T9SS type A sorting domain-containing protein [Bacteroidetes bacterium]|nr:T9SS type A sorting domain-containing protein [Bacteroidota bacterium]
MLYPNPANYSISINANYEEQKVLQLEIYTLQGYRIYSSVYTLNQPLDISKLNSGIYFIKLKNADDLLFVNSLIIQK